MKVKISLKKFIATLLCVSTLSCTVGIVSHADTTIDTNSQFIQFFNATTNTWGNLQLNTLEDLNQAMNSKEIFRICNSNLSSCKAQNLPIQPESRLSKFGKLLLAPLSILGFIGGNAWSIMQGLMIGSFAIITAKNFIKENFGSYFNKNCGNIEEAVDPIEAISRLDKYLEPIKGQEKAKTELRRFVLNSIDDRNQRIRGFSKKKGANIIYLVGPSGVGKSMSAEALTKVLTGDNSKPYIVEPSDIDKESKKASIVDQLFGMRIRKVQMNEIYETSPLVAQVEATPNMVLIINEYDKMCNTDLDEKLRTIADHGYINVNGEMVDFSKVTIIITSNEDTGSITKTDHKDDGTGSRTQVDHDKAFLNRLKIVEFNNLSAKDYIEIEKPLFTILQQRYLNDYNVFVTFEDGLLEKVANLVEQKNKGARPIQEDYIDSINDLLLTDVILKGSKDKSYSGKVINISLKDDGNFVLDKTSNYNKILEILITKLKSLYFYNHNVKLEFSDETINNLVNYLKENNISAELTADIINSLDKIISDSIIAKDSKKKSYMGKSYKIDFNQNWKISANDLSKENKSVKTNSNQDSEVKENTAELNKSVEQKSDTPLEKETTETSIEAAQAA